MNSCAYSGMTGLRRLAIIIGTVATLGILAGLGVFPGDARAEQFTLFDVTYTHATTNTVSGHYYIKPSADTPTNWVSPIDYSQGTAYFQLEVYTKPTDAGSQFHVCFFGKGSSYACGPYAKPGVSDWSAKLTSFYQYNKVDWSKGLDRMPIILTDGTPVNIGVEDVGAAKAAMYMPSMVRVVGIMVSPGGIYVRPGPATDGGVPRVVDAGARDAGMSADRPLDSAAVVILPAPDSAPPSVNADAAPSTPPTGGGGGAGGGTSLAPDAAAEAEDTPVPAKPKPSGCQMGGRQPGRPSGCLLISAAAGLVLQLRRRRIGRDAIGYRPTAAPMASSSSALLVTPHMTLATAPSRPTRTM